MKTSVAFFIFNRPHTTQKVFEAIRQAKPPKLLVVADGPRLGHSGENEKCEKVREIIQRVDWKCEVLTNYSDINLGCRSRVSSGLNWVFDNVESAIILEDDCIPHITFFQFCEELLERYQDDERVTSITGLNVPIKHKYPQSSYYFSSYTRIWGWASWRRAWKNFDIEMKLWPQVREKNILSNLLEDSRAIKYWTKIFQDTYEGKINTWDYAWNFACWLHNGLNIIPNVNLVTNIGFGKEATHTVNINSSDRRSQLPLEEIQFPLQHPSFIIRDKQADQWIENNIHSPSLFMRLKKKMWNN